MDFNARIHELNRVDKVMRLSFFGGIVLIALGIFLTAIAGQYAPEPTAAESFTVPLMLIGAFGAFVGIVGVVRKATSVDDLFAKVREVIVRTVLICSFALVLLSFISTHPSFISTNSSISMWVYEARFQLFIVGLVGMIITIYIESRD